MNKISSYTQQTSYVNIEKDLTALNYDEYLETHSIVMHFSPSDRRDSQLTQEHILQMITSTTEKESTVTHKNKRSFHALHRSGYISKAIQQIPKYREKWVTRLRIDLNISQLDNDELSTKLAFKGHVSALWNMSME